VHQNKVRLDIVLAPLFVGMQAKSFEKFIVGIAVPAVISDWTCK